jgi:hypothetical protein
VIESILYRSKSFHSAELPPLSPLAADIVDTEYTWCEGELILSDKGKTCSSIFVVAEIEIDVDVGVALYAIRINKQEPERSEVQKRILMYNCTNWLVAEYLKYSYAFVTLLVTVCLPTRYL